MRTILLSLLLITSALSAETIIPVTFVQQNRSSVNAAELKSWYDRNKNMVVLDARTKKNASRLPDALSLPYNSPEKKVLSVLPDKDSLIVVYCANAKCPMARKLYDKLSTMGYRNIYVYQDGISDWMRRGYPVTK